MKKIDRTITMAKRKAVVDNLAISKAQKMEEMLCSDQLAKLEDEFNSTKKQKKESVKKLAALKRKQFPIVYVMSISSKNGDYAFYSGKILYAQEEKFSSFDKLCAVMNTFFREKLHQHEEYRCSFSMENEYKFTDKEILSVDKCTELITLND